MSALIASSLDHNFLGFAVLAFRLCVKAPKEMIAITDRQSHTLGSGLLILRTPEFSCKGAKVVFAASSRVARLCQQQRFVRPQVRRNLPSRILLPGGWKEVIPDRNQHLIGGTLKNRPEA